MARCLDLIWSKTSLMLRLSTILFLSLISIVSLGNPTHLEEGMKWKKKGNLVEAIKHFEKAKLENPNNQKAVNEFANAAYELRRYAQALPAYEEMLSKNEKNLDALIKLAKMYSYSSQKFKSVKYAERALKLKPTSNKQKITLGDAFYFVKHYPKAIELYKTIQPSNEYTLHKIAKSYSKMSNFNSASKYFYDVIQLKKEPKATLYYEYGNALYSNNQYKLATRAFLKSKELGFYNSKRINENIALGFFAIKAYEQALEFYKEAKKSAPYDKQLSLDMADCYNKLKQFKKAREIITALQKNNPTDGDLMYAYGMTYYKEGKQSKAEIYFGKAFVMKPSLKNLRYTKSGF